MMYDPRVMSRVTQLLAIRHNLTATVAPAVTDDESNFYDVGSNWIDQLTGNVYICTDPTTGAAVWVQMNGTGDVTGPAGAVADNIATYNGITGKIIKDSGLTQADAASAIGLKHTQGTDQGLDTGGPNAVTAADVKDAADKKHAQGTDQGLDTGGANATTAAEVKDAVDKKHTQGTDQALDTGGANEVTAANAKDAVAKKHTQDTDQFLDFGGVSQSAAVDVADAVAKKHNQVHAASHTNGADDVATMGGDVGAGGTKGLVPAPGAGDAAAGKYLKADATWGVPAGSGLTTLQTTITHDDGLNTSLGTCPAHCMLMYAAYRCTESWNGAAPAIDIGDAADPDSILENAALGKVLGNMKARFQPLGDNGIETATEYFADVVPDGSATGESVITLIFASFV